MMHPCDGTVSQEYNHYPQAGGAPWGHTGRDYRAVLEQTVRTIAQGRIMYCGPGQFLSLKFANMFMLTHGATGSGNLVVVEHDGWYELFAHLNSWDVFIGQWVKRGQRVGGAGTTGNSTGVHLHYETFVTPAPNFPMFGRYHPQLQIDYEDAQAAPQPPKEIPMAVPSISAAEIARAVAVHRIPSNKGDKGFPTGFQQSFEFLVYGADKYARDGAARARALQAQVSKMQTALAAQGTVLSNMSTAIARVAEGEDFDEAKLLAGIKTTTQAAVKDVEERMRAAILDQLSEWDIPAEVRKGLMDAVDSITTTQQTTIGLKP